jgi:flagella basal body P-ring formation protein FlgA
MLALLTIAALAAAGPAPAPVKLDDAAVAAITAAVRARMGVSAAVEIAEATRIEAPRAVPEDAVLDPAAALGVRSRVVFRARDAAGALVPVGGATVLLRVAVDHVHAARPLDRGQVVEHADLAPARHTLPRGRLRPWPQRDALVGGRVTRDLPEGACVVAAAVAPQPLVRPGAPLTAVLRLGGVEARAAVIALDSGRAGSFIRVMNPESRHTVRARVLARDLVEILP